MTNNPNPNPFDVPKRNEIIDRADGYVGQKIINPNPNVEAGERLRQYSATIAEYKQRGETLIRDPLAELQQARARIAELESELDAFIAKLAQSRAECDEVKAGLKDCCNDVKLLTNDLRQCQHERDELRARLNAVRRAAGDV